MKHLKYPIKYLSISFGVSNFIDTSILFLLLNLIIYFFHLHTDYLNKYEIFHFRSLYELSDQHFYYNFITIYEI